MSYEESKGGTSHDFLFGKWLANPPPGEEVVITGLSGRYPNSEDIGKFKENLFNKVDMISSLKARWDYEDPEIPPTAGLIPSIDEFDPGYFGIHQRQATTMDPMTRLTLEKVVEAIFDAGLHPSELEGSKTCVIVCFCGAEHEPSWWWNGTGPENFGMTGCGRIIAANRISYFLKLNGNSFNVDTACSSSLYAVEEAYRSIRTGKYDNAIIASSHLLLHPFSTLKFAKLGVLSPQGEIRPLDEDASGYVRAETALAMLIQKSKNARRIYSQIVHAKVNCDGYKEEGITYPSGKAQQVLLREFYDECNIDPTSLYYLEAHATGTRVGDFEELHTIEEIFCKNRETPLLIGSVKSNMGHSEASSGLCSISKTVIGMECGYIPAHINFKNPRKGIKGFENGSYEVVTEHIPWKEECPLVGINNFGFGGANSHILLRGYSKKRVDKPRDDLPKLVCISGRTEKSITLFLDEVKKNPSNYEFIALINQMFKNDLPTHRHRGFGLVYKNRLEKISINFLNTLKKKLVLFFDNFDETWLDFGKDLMAVPLFSGAIHRIHNTLSTKGINITELIVNGQKSNLESPLNVFLACFSVQLATADVLKSLDIKYDRIQGVSTGDLIANYFNDNLTLEQTLSIAYSYGNLLKTSKWDQAKLEVKNENPKPEIIQRVSKKSFNGYIGDDNHIFNRKNSEFRVDKDAGNNLVIQVQEILSRSANGNGNNREIAENVAQSLLNSSRGKTENFGFDSVILEVGFGTLHTRDEQEGSSHIYFNPSNDENGVVVLSEVLGNLYLSGHNYSIEKLYPKVDFPVSKGTPMISPLIGWEHSKKCFVKMFELNKTSGKELKTINVTQDEWAFLKGHVIDGRNLFPATGYLYLVWEVVLVAHGLTMHNTSITFQDVKFMRATTIPENDTLQFTVTVQKGSSDFELLDGENLIVSGKVFLNIDDDVDVSVSDKLDLEMKENDIYKELKLRGYNYSGLFRSMRGCNVNATIGTIQWQDNWIAFLDNLLQMQILRKDTRNLYVPIGLRKLVINTANHLKFIKSYEDHILPIQINHYNSVLSCGFVELEGLDASIIARRKPRGEPVLEKYVFVPNETKLTSQESVRVNMQIALENNWLTKIVAYELIDDEARDDVELLSPFVLSALEDQPLIQPVVTILTKKEIEIPNVNAENKNLTKDMECYLIIATNLSNRKQLLEQSLGIVKDGYILSREPLDFPSTTTFEGAEILTTHTTENETLVFLHKTPQTKTPSIIKITNADTFHWLQELKSVYSVENDIVLYAQEEPVNGLLGLTNCLRREPDGKRTKCVFIDDDSAPTFQATLDFYEKQLKKGLSINVFKNGTWGTYRHLLLEEAESVESEHVYVNVKTHGDLSSLRWFEGPLKENDALEPEKTMIRIYYSPLNFRDVMIVTGKMHPDLVTAKRIKQGGYQGFEFVGKDLKGNRVMGLMTAGAMANLAVVNNAFIFPVPDNWSMEEASSVAVVYITVLFSLLKTVRIRRGQSILIHAGTGGVGQAAINVCLHFGLKVFTTVGTQEKREFIKNQFPQIKDSHIGNSRDTSFEQMVLKGTHGRGVDYVLNSLSEEKLVASVRCVAKGGHFIEIGKFDLSNDSRLSIQLFAKGASFHAVMVDMFFDTDPRVQKVLGDLLMRGIKEGYVKPLKTTVFEADQVENAFRYLGSGKHMGKVVLRVRKEDSCPKFKGTPRYFCDSKHSYIITGGLGGFGLELADWLVLRGARKLILTSRTGIKTGYQAFRIKLWESYGVELKISIADISTKVGCVQLIREANEMGPVQGIFNLAVVLADALLENQTEESFRTSFGAKAWAVRHLDEISREECQNLRDFVVFSSVSCGRGNAGQTNYGMSNSVMEKICEERHKAGLPALAIEWGAVGDVGLVAEMQNNHMELEIAGTLQQRISSCLSVLDVLLKQKNPIVSSMVVAEKKCSGDGNVIDAIANILGIVDMKTISQHSTLSELGMDSMMSVEVKQILERECQVFLSSAEIRSLTFVRLQELLDEKVESEEAANNTGHQILVNCVGGEDLANLDSVLLPSAVEDDQNSDVVFLLPGIEGTANALRNLAKILKFKTICLQYSGNSSQNDIEKLARSLLPQILSNLRPEESFRIVAHSFGTLIGLQLIQLLEDRGISGKIIFIDGAPELISKLTHKQFNLESDTTLETDIICGIMSYYMPINDVLAVKEKLLTISSSKERLEAAFTKAPPDVLPLQDYIKQTITEVFQRFKAIVAYSPKALKTTANVVLCRPKIHLLSGEPEDYNLSELLGQKVAVNYFDGTHLSILDNPEVAEFANQFFELRS